MIKKIEMKKYVSHWAFLPLRQFAYHDSLKELRRDFGYISKMGMLVDATYESGGGQVIRFQEDEMDALDSVNDFVEYLKDKGITKLDKPPEGR